jgi:predicted 3-demethylubiquinone-9 3-methyltransferase (glyoxalase superfamily)
MLKTQKITPALLFVGKQAGKAEEAIRFYTSLFKESKIVTLERYAPGEGDKVGWIKFGAFMLAGQSFTAMESSLDHKFTFTPAVSLFVTCESEKEIDDLYAKLSEGGMVLMEYGKYPFADKYAWVNDSYGVSWQLMLRGGAGPMP